MRDELTAALKQSESLPIRLRTALARIVEQLPKLSYELPHEPAAYRVPVAATRRATLRATDWNQNFCISTISSIETVASS